jgi:hypothetical protein
MKQNGASELALKCMRNEMQRQSRKFMKVSFKDTHEIWMKRKQNGFRH